MFVQNELSYLTSFIVSPQAIVHQVNLASSTCIIIVNFTATR